MPVESWTTKYQHFMDRSLVWMYNVDKYTRRMMKAYILGSMIVQVAVGACGGVKSTWD